MKPTLHLKEGRFYRTRDGRKVGPMTDKHEDAGFRHRWTDTGETHARFWTDAGTYNEYVEEPDPLDIVAEWPTTAEATTAEAAAAQQLADYAAMLSAAAPAETELERLVRVANRASREYIDAYKELQAKYANRVHAYKGPQDISDLPFRTALGNTLLIKPRPAFPEFHVGGNFACSGDGWLVRLSDDGKTLHVGCRQFEARAALTALQAIKSGQYSSFTVYSDVVHSYRDGIGVTTNQGQQLSWPDADRLLAALEAYFAATKEAA